MLHTHEDFYPDYPEDWIDVTEGANHDYLLPTHVTNVASRTTYALAEASGTVLQNAPYNVKHAVLAIRILGPDLHEHSYTVHGIKSLVLAQKQDLHVLALKKFVNNENIAETTRHLSGGCASFCPQLFQTKKGITVLELQRFLYRSDYCMNGLE